MNYVEILSLFTDETNKRLAKPFHNGTHVYATNGYSFVSLPKRLYECDENKPFADAITKAMNSPLTRAVSRTYSVTGFKEVLAKITKEDEFEDCPQCEGNGYVVCVCCDGESDCKECDGVGHTAKVIGQKYSPNEITILGSAAIRPVLIEKIVKVCELIREPYFLQILEGSQGVNVFMLGEIHIGIMPILRTFEIRHDMAAACVGETIVT